VTEPRATIDQLTVLFGNATVCPKGVDIEWCIADHLWLIGLARSVLWSLRALNAFVSN